MNFWYSQILIKYNKTEKEENENEVDLNFFFCANMMQRIKLANSTNLAFTIGQPEAESVFSSVNFLIPNARTTSGFESPLPLSLSLSFISSHPPAEWNKVVQARAFSLLAYGA